MGPIWFEVVNSASWSVVLGAPLLLFLKAHDAPAIVLGAAVAMSPLLQILQPLGARLLHHRGYRATMVRGWTARTALTLLIVAVIWWSEALGPWWTVALTMALLSGFCVIRGLTSCAWMPWMSQLVPDSLRGRFLSASQGSMQVTVLLCQAGYALILAKVPGVPGFTLLFIWSALMGWVAAWMLGRIPDRPVAAEGPPGPVAWRSLLGHQPFRALLAFNLVAWIAFAGAGVLWVPVLRDLYGCSDGFIALMPVWAGLAGVAILPLLSQILDRVGSRPVLALALVVVALHFVLWALLAAHVMPLALPAVIAIQVTGGAAFTAWGVANTRLAMACVPPQGRSHYFALHGAVAALGYGVFPIVWGGLLDVLAAHGGTSWRITAHAWLYLAMAVITLAALAWHRRLIEPEALSNAAFLSELRRLPGRAWARWWPDR